MKKTVFLGLFSFGLCAAVHSQGDGKAVKNPVFNSKPTVLDTVKPTTYHPSDSKLRRSVPALKNDSIRAGDANKANQHLTNQVVISDK